MMFMVAGCNGNQNATNDTSNSVAATGELQIKMLNIGQGDALLIRTESQTILIDTGDDKYYEDGKKGQVNNQLFEALAKENVKTIDKLILTHAHADHIGKAPNIVAKYNVKEVIYNGIPSKNKYLLDTIKNAKAKNITVTKVKEGDKLDFGGGATFTVLSPSADLVAKDTKSFQNNGKMDANDESVVGRLTYGSFSMLFTGDAESPIEKDLVAKYGNQLKSTVLKSGHHGSKTSSSKGFVKAVQPEAVLISLGAKNQYGHPHQVTLDTYQSQGIKNVLRTDLAGTITLISNGKDYTIKTEK